MRRRAFALRGVLLLGLLVSTGCDEGGEGRVLAIEATGVVDGNLYFDRNGNRQLDGSDDGVPSVGVRLVLRGTEDTVAGATTAIGTGRYVVTVPVGEYEIRLDRAIFGDTIRIVRVDLEEDQRTEGDTSVVALTVGAGETKSVDFFISYPKLSVTDARSLPEGRKAFLEGIVLNDRATFGDTTAHLADASGAIRGTRVGTAVAAGDSVRWLGTLRVRDGQPTLDGGTVFHLGTGQVPSPVVLNTGLATTGDGGRLDAALVRVLQATIVDTATVAEGFELLLDDGSGVLRALLDRDASFSLGLYTPGAVFDATGLLVPRVASGAWRLKPRSDLDLVSP